MHAMSRGQILPWDPKITDASMVRDHTGWVMQSIVSLIFKELVRWDQPQEMWGD